MGFKFSIITVCYNSEKTIKDTINSVENQTYSNYEHIIIDGASTDNTIELVNEYENRSGRVKFLSEPDNGIYDAMNKGIGLATGDLIVFLNSDDTFEYKALEIINQNYKLDMDLIFGDVYWLEKYKNNIYERKLDIDPEQAILNNKMIPHNSTFVKSSIMKENVFDTNLKICSDYKFFLHMYRQQRNIAHVPYRITNMSMGGISTTQLELGLIEHVQCQLEVLGYTDIDIKRRTRYVKVESFVKKVSKFILPSRIYVKYRFFNKGWKIRERINH